MSCHAYTNAVRYENASVYMGLLFFFGIEHQIVRVELHEFVELMTFFYGINLMVVSWIKLLIWFLYLADMERTHIDKQFYDFVLLRIWQFIVQCTTYRIPQNRSCATFNIGVFCKFHTVVQIDGKILDTNPSDWLKPVTLKIIFQPYSTGIVLIIVKVNPSLLEY